MLPSASDPLERKLSAFVQLQPEELTCLADMQGPALQVKSGKRLTEEGQVGQKIYVLREGWACSYKDLANGNRQIISFPIPGDCVGVRSSLLKTADHTFAALTDAVVKPVEPAHLVQCFQQFPRLAAALLWSVSRDEAMVVEHLVNIGRRSAIERTAHFFLELGERLSLIGAASETEYDCPLNQYVLADALGLTAIHVNRVLRELREDKLLTVRKGKVEIHDLVGLKKLAGYLSSI
jgi:CRP-like cAMP-binding protein